MHSVVSYSAKITDLNRPLDGLVSVCREATEYLTQISLRHYDGMSDMSQLEKQSFLEHLVHRTAKNNPLYDTFDQRFAKMPSYLRRACCNTANGIASSYMSQVANWEKDGCKGKKPFLHITRNSFPCLYRGNMFQLNSETGEFTIKTFLHGDWIWVTGHLCKSDLKYLRRFEDFASTAPVIKKKNKAYYLRFAFEIEHTDKYVPDKDVTMAVGADLGVNTDAVCSAVTSSGTVAGVSFIDSPVEKDRMYSILRYISSCQKQGNYKNHRLWRFVNNYNREIAIKTANGILEFALLYHAQVIVFEHLDFKGARTRNQKIGIWRKRDIQKRVEEKAARFGIRVSYVCAKNTSRLAFDGSGPVVRDPDNHALCTFTTGKQYNCDLSASKNIAARYLIRAMEKTITAMSWLSLLAKVPGSDKRTSRTLSTFINLCAAAAG